MQLILLIFSVNYVLLNTIFLVSHIVSFIRYLCVQFLRIERLRISYI
jgi:hypothetical protein